MPLMTTDGLPHQVLAKLETTLALSHAEDAARLEAELQQARAALQGAAEQHRRQRRQLCARFDMEREQLLKSTKRLAHRHAHRHAQPAISEPSTQSTPTTTPKTKSRKNGPRAGRRTIEVDLRHLDDFPASVADGADERRDERLRLGRTCDPGGDGLVARLWDVLAGPDKGQGKAQGKVRKSRASAFDDSADNAILGHAPSPATASPPTAKAVTGAASSATKRAFASRGKHVAAALALRPPPLGPPRAPPLSSLLQAPLQSALLDSPPSSMPSSPSAGAALFDRGDVAEPSSDGRWRQPRPPPLRIRSPHTSLLGSPVQAVQAVH